MEETKVLKKKKVISPSLRFNGFKDAWNIMLLGELGSFKNGLNKDSSDFGFGSPFVNLMDVFGKSILTENNFGLVNATDKDIETYNLKKGDVLFIRSSVKRTGVGETILVAKDLPNTVYSGFLIRFRDNNKELDLNFKSYCFSNTPFRKELLSYATSSANTNINQESLAQIKVHFPSLPEQQKIASFLSAVDEKIQLLNRKKQLLEQYKKGVMQQLFSGKLRFKDENGKTYPKWEEKKLGELAVRIGDGIHTTPKYDDNGNYYFVNGNNLTNGKIVINESTKKISESEYLKHNRELGKNTILFSINGTIGNIAFYDNEQIVLGKSACYINLSEAVDLKFIYLILQSSATINYYNAELTGSTIRNLSLRTVRETPINFPCIEEQKKIADFLSAIDVKIESLSNQINQTQNFKKGLLQQMFV